MKAVICVAQYKNTNQVGDFLSSLSTNRTPSYSTVDWMIVNTDASCVQFVGPYPANSVHQTTIPWQRRQYASIMFEKIKAVAPICDDDTIFFNCDPDYSFNLHALEFAHLIFTENPQVDYLCLLKEPALANKSLSRITLSGFTFVKYPSCMGGAMICRWKTFYPQVQKFFAEYGVTGEDSGRAGGFDQTFWKFLTKEKGGKNGDDKHVYMLDDFSLVQHCNTISNFLGSKGPTGVRSHMYGLDFDPRINPFEWRDKLPS